MNLTITPGDLYVVAFIVILIVIEWRYRAKRDGKVQATAAMMVAAGIFLVGLLAMQYFGLAGLAGLAMVLLTATIAIVWRRSRSSLL